MKIRLITDSTTDVGEKNREGLIFLPVTVRFGEEEYLDGVNLTRGEFYQKLVEHNELPTTSQVTPYTFAEAFREAVEAGEQVIVITLSSKLSGTWQSACIAAKEFLGKVWVIDSESVCIGTGILVKYAQRLIAQGWKAEAIVAEIEVKKKHISVIALLDTLEYLKKGGRISGAVAMVGGFLSIKPVVSLSGGEVVLLGKARGSKQGNNLLIKQIEEDGGVDFTMPILLGYTGISDALLQKYMEDSATLWEGQTDNLPATIISGAVGAHVGPGAIAVAFFKSQ